MGNHFAKIFIALTFISLNIYGSVSAFAQSKAAETATAELALSQDKNRLQILIDGAKKEGELTIYYSARDIAPVVDAFSRKYGVKVKQWKSSGENVLQRILAEARGGRFEVDLVGNEATGMEALHREKLLQQVKSPYQGDLMPQAIPAHGEWVATSIDIYVQAYNTEKIKKEDLPKTYHDLLDPKWKGRLGIEADDYPWFATLVQALGQEKGIKLFKDIVAANGISVRKGHNLLTNMVASGEVPLSLTMYDYLVQQTQQKGAPINVFFIPPTVASFKGIALLRNAPHPHAALLFYDFMLTDGQQILSERHLVPTSKKIDTPFKKLSLTFIDPVLSVDLNDKWLKVYEESVTKGTKK